MAIPEKAAPVTGTTLETAGRLSAVNAIGIYVCTFVWSSHIQQQECMDQPGKVANPALESDEHGKMNVSLFPFTPEKLIPRDGFGRPVPRQLPHSPHSG